METVLTNPTATVAEEKVVIGFDPCLLEDSWAMQNDGVYARGLREEVNPKRRDEDVANRGRGVKEKFSPHAVAVGKPHHHYFFFPSGKQPAITGNFPPW